MSRVALAVDTGRGHPLRSVSRRWRGLPVRVELKIGATTSACSSSTRSGRVRRPQRDVPVCPASRGPADGATLEAATRAPSDLRPDRLRPMAPDDPQRDPDSIRGACRGRGVTTWTLRSLELGQARGLLGEVAPQARGILRHDHVELMMARGLEHALVGGTGVVPPEMAESANVAHDLESLPLREPLADPELVGRSRPPTACRCCSAGRRGQLIRVSLRLKWVAALHGGQIGGEVGDRG